MLIRWIAHWHSGRSPASTRPCGRTPRRRRRRGELAGDAGMVSAGNAADRAAASGVNVGDALPDRVEAVEVRRRPWSRLSANSVFSIASRKLRRCRAG